MMQLALNSISFNNILNNLYPISTKRTDLEKKVDRERQSQFQVDHSSDLQSSPRELKERAIQLLKYNLSVKHELLSSLNTQSYKELKKHFGNELFFHLAQYRISKESHYQDLGKLMECLEQLYQLDPSIPQHIKKCIFFSHLFFFFKLKESSNEDVIKKISDEFLEYTNLGMEILAYFLKSKKEYAFGFIKDLLLSDRNKHGLAFTTLSFLLNDIEPNDSQERNKITNSYLEHFEMLDESEDPDPFSHL